MTKDKDAEITKISAMDSDFTKVTFSPDLAKFKMRELDDDIISLMARRAYDVAGTSGIKVYLNGELVPVSIFLVTLFKGGEIQETGMVILFWGLWC